MYRTSEYAIERALNLLKILLAIEDREPGMLELQEATRLNYRTLRKYVLALERLGLVEIEPTERKNIVRLTERGRCIARCLVS